jgi:two-component system response regulator YesN
MRENRNNPSWLIPSGRHFPFPPPPGSGNVGHPETDLTEKADYYKLILVDDEDEVRGRISSKISEESGFKVVGTAGNGHDALELIDKHSPHVVITDIRMPFVDGLELAGTIKREYPTIRVAFITGYDEFDYAKEAIDLGVRSYLTKPLTQNEVSDFLTKLKGELDEEFRANIQHELMQSRYEDSLPLLIDNSFSLFLSNATSGDSDEIQFLIGHGIILKKVSRLLYIHVERDEGDPDVFKREKRKISVRTSVKDLLIRRGLPFHHFTYQEGIVFIIEKTGTEFRDTLDEALLEAVQTARMYHEARIDIGVSADFKGFDELKRAYLEARRSLADSQFLSTGRIAYFEEMGNSVHNTIVMSDADLKTLDYAVKFGSDENLRSVIHEVRTTLASMDDAPVDYRLYVLNLLSIATGFASSIGVDITTVCEGDVLETVGRLTGLEQAFDWFYATVSNLRRANLQVKMSNSELLLEKAIAFMSSNFSNPSLNLEQTCDAVGVSVSYLSLLFKKHKDLTFVKYLTGLRLDRAKELLKYSGDRIIEIAEQCGYKDVYYFSHSFKKTVGISPKQYRENQTAI